MANIHKKYLSSISSRSGPSNALSNSVLLDDEAPTSSAAAQESAGSPPKPPPEQRIQLLQAFLAIGDLPSSMYFLGKFPWVAQSHPPIADLILRNLQYALEEVYRQYAERLEGTEEEEIGLQDPAPTYASSTKEVVPTLLSPSPPETEAKIYEFFYSNWRETCEVWSSIDEIREKGLKWLSLVRGLGSRMVELMVKICRVGAAHFVALRKDKEAALGISHGAKTKEERRSTEVRRLNIMPVSC